MVDHEQNLKHLGDIILGATGVSSIAWLPILHNINEFAATIAAIGGAILVLIRLYFAFLAWRAYRKSGSLPQTVKDELE